MKATLPRPDPVTATRPRASYAGGVPGHVSAVLFASGCVVVGVLWDISWHQSIGRDTFFSPPHLAIYLGGVVAGIACGWNVLHTTFAGLPEDRAASVSFWRYFRGPLGGWMCIWGAIAMLTSAPFDDWWHGAYGLDVKILSPPHALLAAGILAIQLGALFLVVALQNRHSLDGGAMHTGAAAPHHRWIFAFAAGLVLLNFAVMATEYTWRVQQHGTLFYQVVAGVLIIPLVAAGVAGRMRWAATATALTYSAVLLAMHFVLPLFPAEPKLAPVYFQVTRMVPPQFPLLLVVPALFIDAILRRWRWSRSWLLAATLSVAFVLSFVLVQWPFAEFLQSEHARNAIFKQDVRPYMVPEESLMARGEFYNPAGGVELVRGLAIALGTVSSRIALACGGWMRGVQR
jgi:hypothetical protein